MNLRDHIDLCVGSGIPLKTCVVVNYKMGIAAVDAEEVDLSLLKQKELRILEKEGLIKKKKLKRKK